MAFVNICKGDKSLRIPLRAYEKQYAPAGWSLEDEKHIGNPVEGDDSQKDAPEDEKLQEDGKNEGSQSDGSNPDLDGAGNDNDGDGDNDGDNDEDDEEDDFDIEELEEKPLSELSVPELRALAAHKGVDITGLTSAKKLREAIKDAE